jgi:hypothetical protein
VWLIGATPSGSDVFFTTADPLVPGDTDTQVDIYDARVDGGFPAPTTPRSCEGEGCQGPPATPPVFGAPGSAIFSGNGNLAPLVAANPPPAKRTAAQIRAEKLSKALKACRTKHNKEKRAFCEKQAKKRYGKVK